MSTQTAAGARAAFLNMVTGLSVFAGIREDEIDPRDLPQSGVFATIQEGGDFTSETIIGGENPLYEVYSVLNVDILTYHKDKALEAARRASLTNAIAVDPALGGLVDDVRIVRADNQTEPEEGARKARATSITIELHYISTSPVG